MTLTDPRELLQEFETAGVADLIADMTDPDEVADLLGDTFGEAFALLSRRHQAARAAHSDPLALSISGLGGCVREGAYRLAGTTPSDPHLMNSGQNRQAVMGTIIDSVLLPAVAELVGGETQVAVELRAGETVLIRGSADLVVGTLLLELKSAREARIVAAIGAGPYERNRVQAISYGVGLTQMGRDIRWVAYVYLDRATGQEYVAVEPLTLDAQMWALGKVWDIAAWRERPDRAPRTERGPGLSFACDRCGWLQRCWGRGARPSTPGPQRRLGRSVGEIEQILIDYVELGQQATAIKDERELLQTIFTSGSRPGNYGDLRWYRTREGEQLDQAEAIRLLQEAGIPVPMVPRSGQVRIAPAAKDQA